MSKTEIKTENKVSLALIGVERGEKGIKLTVKSKFFEGFFRDLHSHKDKDDMRYMTKSNNPGWEEKLAYAPAEFKDGLELCKDWGGKFYGNSPNLSFLRARGIENGLTFNFEGIHSDTVIKKWLEETKEHMFRIYKEHMKDKKFVMTIQVSEVADG